MIFFALLTIGARSYGQIPRWAFFEDTLENEVSYQNPFHDVSLEVSFIKPDGGSGKIWGFYCGDHQWRFRILTDQVGEWRWHAHFSDGSRADSGTFTCIPSEIPGMISAYQANPIWFGYRHGEAVLLRSLHVGDCFFADRPNTLEPEKIWSDTLRAEFLDWAQHQGYNMLSIAGHLLNRREKGRGLGWNTPRLWNSETQCPIPQEYDRLEKTLNDLAARKMIVYPFAGIFGKSAEWPADSTLRIIYLKYTLARLSPYWNLLFLVAGPEPLHSETGNAYQNVMARDDINHWGELIARLDPFHHLLSVHNRTETSDEGDPFKAQPWYSFSTIQGPKTLDRKVLAEKTLMNLHPAKPYYAQETLWAGNVWHPDYGLEDLRKNAIVLNMCAASINFADNAGTSSTGFSGHPLLANRVQIKHDIMKRVWDFFESLPFYDLSPAPQWVDDGFCLAKRDSLLLVYLENGGETRLLNLSGNYQLEWINARNTDDRFDGGVVDAKRPLVAPSVGEDWFAWLARVN